MAILIIVVEDPIPKYGFYQSLGKSISMVILILLKQKTRYEIIWEKIIHSSSSISEVFYHASLLFQTTEYKICKHKSVGRNLHILEQI